MFRKTKEKDEPSRPDAPHVEIWDHLYATHRLYKRVAVAAIALAFLGMGYAAYTSATALSHPLVYYVDTDGRAVFGGTLETTCLPAEQEVRYVTRQFLRRALGLNSLTVERDLADMFNLMTMDLQRQHEAELAEYQEEKKSSFVDYVRGQGIRTDVKVMEMELSRGDRQTWSVHAEGIARVWPLNAVGEQAGYKEQAWTASVTLVEVPRDELSPNGLLVAQRAIRFFAPSAATAQEETVPQTVTP